MFGRATFSPKSVSGEDSKRQQDARNAAQQEMFNKLVAAQRFIPPLWLSLGTQGLAERRVLPALLGTFGCLGLATLGLRRVYRSTVKFYHGDAGGKTAVRSKSADVFAEPPSGAAKSGSRFLEWRLPAVPEQSAALALATFRGLFRAPEVKMALGSSVISMLILGAMVFLRNPPHLSDTTKPFVATGVLTFSIFTLLRFFANQFGFDRDGFRSLILSPADRRLILLGKNLAVLPIGFVFGTLLLAVVFVWLHLPPLVVLAGLFQPCLSGWLPNWKRPSFGLFCRTAKPAQT